MDVKIDVPWGRMNVRRGGSGPKLVLIHGYLVSSQYFSAVRPQLEERFEVFAFDLPGHGDSDRPAPGRCDYSLDGLAQSVVAGMEALGIERAHVWGHSLGGGTALTLAARHPARVERLIIEDAVFLEMPMPLLAHLASVPLLGGVLFRNLYSRRDLSNHLHGVHKDPAVCTEADIDLFWEQLNRPGGRAASHAMLQTMMGLKAESDLLPRIQAPTLVVFGAEEKTVPVENGRRIAAAIPGARFELVAGCGHSPHEEKPAEMLALALPFLSGAAEPEAARHHVS